MGVDKYRDEMVCLYAKDGLTLDEVGRRFGVTRQRVHQIIGKQPKNHIARFWKLVEVHGPNDCWEWLGSRDQNGYGICPAGRKWLGTSYAHRIMWTITHNPIPNGLYILHSCDNPSCVNPGHLRVGTQADNMQDMTQRGRSRRKLSTQDIATIRQLFPSISARVLSGMFGVTRCTIYNVLY